MYTLPASSLRLAVFSLGLLLVTTAVVLAGCGAGAAEAPAPAPLPLVDVDTVGAEGEALPVQTSGRLARKAEVDLSFKIGGVVGEIRADEGDIVRRGQVLGRLVHDEIDAEVQRAQSGLDKAQRDLARFERLHRDTVATLENVQDAQTAVEVAASALRIATFNQRYATIVAPHDGRILRRAAEAGELVSPGTPLFTLGVEGAGWVVRVGLADRDVVRLAEGDRAEITFDAYPGEPFEAHVAEIADAADAASGTFEVELAVPDPARRLKSGFVGKVDLFPEAAEAFTLLPIEVLVEGDGDRGVVVAFEPVPGRDAEPAEGTVHRRAVRIARLMDREVAIASGLEGVRYVVTEGALGLPDSSRVLAAGY